MTLPQRALERDRRDLDLGIDDGRVTTQRDPARIGEDRKPRDDVGNDVAELHAFELQATSPALIRFSSNRSLTSTPSDGLARSRAWYAELSSGAGTTPSSSASTIARSRASGVRRSCEIQDTSSRRASASSRSRARLAEAPTHRLQLGAASVASSSAAGRSTGVHEPPFPICRVDRDQSFDCPRAVARQHERDRDADCPRRGQHRPRAR